MGYAEQLYTLTRNLTNDAGNPTHLSEAARVLGARFEAEDDATRATHAKVEILVASTNAEEGTYDGIDWGGERVVEEYVYVLLAAFRLFTGSAAGSMSGLRSWRRKDGMLALHYITIDSNSSHLDVLSNSLVQGEFNVQNSTLYSLSE